MIEINNKRLCENCFAETDEAVCPHCGYCKNIAESNDQILSPGTILNGKYVVGKSLGSGGFGITYLGYNVHEEKKVAIKEYFPKTLVYRKHSDTTVRISRADQTQGFEKGRMAFFEEAKTISKFNGNLNIVSVYEFFLENDTAYFVMEYLEGKDLRKYITDRGSNLTNDETREMMKAIASALFITHTLDVLHRDVSNVNIFVCNDGTYKLIDFGSARQFSMERTQSMSVILNPGFAPLEQYQRHGKQGPWTDIYALGATAYWALTGELLDDPMTRLNSNKLISIKGTDIDPELFKVICKCISLDIKNRYQDIPSLLRDLNKKANPKPIIKYAAVSAAVVAVITAGAVLIGGALNKDEPTWTPTKNNGGDSNNQIDEYIEDPAEIDRLYEDALEYYGRKEYTEAYEAFLEVAETEHAGAMYYIGLLYQNGYGVNQNHEKALGWYKKAAELGHAAAMRNIGVFYEDRWDYTQALEWYEKAKAAGYGADEDIARVKEKIDAVTAEIYYEIAKEHDEDGDYTNAIECYTKAAELDHVNAIYRIGEIYYNGLGVSQDYIKALEWYTKAAELGNSSAMFYVGYIYASGIGGITDYAKALEWYTKSAELGNLASMNNLGAMYDRGTGVAQNYEKALELFTKAANSGHAYAMCSLGIYYEFGRGVTVDYTKALEWYEKAKAAGYDSDDAIARVKEKMK